MGLTIQAPVVQKVDKAIHWINLYPLDSAIGFPNTYPLDFEQPGPVDFSFSAHNLVPRAFPLRRGCLSVVLFYGIVEGLCQEDIAVLSQFCAGVIT